MKRIFSLFLALFLVVAIPSVTSAHTGGIRHAQNCTSGTIVIAHLDDNVSADRTWSLEVNGVVVEAGTGPGPLNIGPVHVRGRGAGSATLHISVDNTDENSYTTSWSNIPACDKHHTYASIAGPCGDPMYRFHLRTFGKRTVFYITMNIFGKGWRTFTRTLSSNDRFDSAYKHVQGDTRMIISTGGKVLVSRMSRPGGNYGRCPA